MKSLTNHNKKPAVANNKKKQLSIILDKENVPPSITTSPTPIKRSSSSSSSQLLSLSCNKKKTKIRKSVTTSRNKKKPPVKCLPQDEIIKMNSKKQEEKERSHPNVVSPIITANVDLISRRLKDNLTKATYNMMACLVLSNQPHDHHIYERLFKSSHSLEYKKTLKNNNHYHQSNMETLVSGAAALETNNNNNSNNNNVSPPSFIKQKDLIPTINQSFDIEQENDFISTWLQHDTGGGGGNCSEYSSSCMDSYDTFSIITEQELSDLLSQQEDCFLHT